MSVLSLQQFVDHVHADFKSNQQHYLAQAQRLMPHAGIHYVELSGSYGRRTPREDSDIDMAVHYRGDVSPEDIVTGLAGRIHGVGGGFDVHPKRTKP